jgi:hypothetical protein
MQVATVISPMGVGLFWAEGRRCAYLTTVRKSVQLHDAASIQVLADFPGG